MMRKRIKDLGLPGVTSREHLMTQHSVIFGIYIFSDLAVRIGFIVRTTVKDDSTHECQAILSNMVFGIIRFITNMATVGLLTYISIKICEPIDARESTRSEETTTTGKNTSAIKSQNNSKVLGDTTNEGLLGSTSMMTEAESMARAEKFHKAAVQDANLLILKVLLESKEKSFEES